MVERTIANRVVPCSNHGRVWLVIFFLGMPGNHIADEFMSACSTLTVMPKPPSTLLRRSLRTRHFHDLAHKDASSSVKITTLPNRIRVATEATPGHFASVGLYIDAGSRYETPSTSGVSHFLDRMAFKVCIYGFSMFRYSQ